MLHTDKVILVVEKINCIREEEWFCYSIDEVEGVVVLER